METAQRPTVGETFIWMAPGADHDAVLETVARVVREEWPGIWRVTYRTLPLPVEIRREHRRRFPHATVRNTPGFAGCWITWSRERRCWVNANDGASA